MHKKFILFALTAFFLSVIAISCSSDDEPEIESTEIAGTWQCVSAKVSNIDMAYDGITLPDLVLDMLKDRTEESLEGETVIIDSSKVKINGNVVIFKDSGIEWHINSITDKEMNVTYETSNSMDAVKLKMTVIAKYKRIK